MKTQMTSKLSRKQVSDIIFKQRQHQVEQAIKTQQDIPYFDNDPIIWHNQYSINDSLRLSKSGLFELKNLVKIYPVPLKQGFQVKNVHIKYLELELTYPYYLDNKMLILFSPRDVLEIKLHDGDLDSWTRSKWINDKYQEPPVLPEDSE